MVAGREVDDAVDATPDTKHATSAEVMGNELRRVAGLGRLARGEEAVLGGRSLEELVPVGRALGSSGHARNLSQAFVLCNLEATGAAVRPVPFGEGNLPRGWLIGFPSRGAGAVSSGLLAARLRGG